MKLEIYSVQLSKSYCAFYTLTRHLLHKIGRIYDRFANPVGSDELYRIHEKIIDFRS